MAVNKFKYQIEMLASNKSKKHLEGFKKDIGSVNSAVSQLRNTIVAAFSFREVVEAANIMIGVENRMNALTGSTEKTAIAMQHMRTIASDSRSDFDAVAMLYTRLSLATEHLGATQRDVADATQTVANTFIIAGSHAQEANNSARQLAQGLASGALRGDELRSVMENNTILTKMLADGLNMTIGELREFGHAGKLTAETVMPILIAGTRQTNEEIMKMPMTLGQAAVALRNNFQFMVGDIQNATQGFSKIADVVKFFATNLDALLIPGIIAATFAMKAFTMAVIANPFGLILTALTTAAMAAYVFRNAIADSFKEIKQDLRILVREFKIFGLKVKVAINSNLIMPIETALTGFMNFIFNNINSALGKIDGVLDKLPKKIKDKLGISKIPKIDLLPDPTDKSGRVKEKIEAYIAEIEKITGEVIKKSDIPTFTEMIFGKPEDAKDDGKSGFGKLTALQNFLKDAETGYKTFFSSIKSMQDEMQGVFQKSYDGITNLTMEFLKNGKASFKDFATTIVTELLRIAMQKLIIDKMFESFGGLFKKSPSVDTSSLKLPTTIPSNEGGGFTGLGNRSGGVDGKGGFLSVLHPNETVIDHAKGQSVGGGSPTINFNISTIDAAGFDQLLASRKGLITSIINNAMNNQGRMGIV